MAARSWNVCAGLGRSRNFGAEATTVGGGGELGERWLNLLTDDGQCTAINDFRLDRQDRIPLLFPYWRSWGRVSILHSGFCSIKRGMRLCLRTVRNLNRTLGIWHIQIPIKHHGHNDCIHVDVICKALLGRAIEENFVQFSGTRHDPVGIIQSSS